MTEPDHPLQPDPYFRRMQWPENPAAYEEAARAELGAFSIEIQPDVEGFNPRWRILAPGEPICLCHSGRVYVGCPTHGDGHVTIADGPAYHITGRLPDDHPHAPGWYIDRVPTRPAWLETWFLVIVCCVILGAIGAGLATAYGLIDLGAW